jgi:hypothetical protein
MLPGKFDRRTALLTVNVPELVHQQQQQQQQQQCQAL